jgi:hypothetical protein
MEKILDYRGEDVAAIFGRMSTGELEKWKRVYEVIIERELNRDRNKDTGMPWMLKPWGDGLELVKKELEKRRSAELTMTSVMGMNGANATEGDRSKHAGKIEQLTIFE